MNNVRYIAILRGINVSGQKLIKMKDLVSLLEKAGLKEVRNYIQSGNIAFQSDKQPLPVLVDTIQAAIKKEYGFDVPTQILTAEKLQKVIDGNPYLSRPNVDLAKIYIVFLDQIPAVVPDIDTKTLGRDEFVIQDDVIYLYLNEGAGRTKLNNNFWESKLKVNATSRNWRTTLKLLELTGQ
ncbi:MAG: DUF1697 domain-containing protein [Saprospiraceae bacterium]|nr:DUF1697 domain-containing protein [Saprospiraceae bacterium]